MKKLTTYFIIVIAIFKSSVLIGQDFGKKDSLRISFLTDVNFSSSSDDGRKQSRSGIGTIGLKFETGYIYGSTNFTVYSQNENISTDSTETKIFGSNLLLPENSSSKVSNFSFLLGVKTFFLKEEDIEAATFSFKRIGANVEFKVNNNLWSRDSISVPITINTFNFNINYTLLNAKILNSDERIRLILSGGFTSRRLGGDFGLNSNKELRKSFLGTDKLAFNGANIGFRLEISKFYGEMNLTNFDRSLNISGFSGDQSIITLGLIADLTLVAEDLGLKKKK
jgi:hypothetical protein